MYSHIFYHRNEIFCSYSHTFKGTKFEKKLKNSVVSWLPQKPNILVTSPVCLKTGDVLNCVRPYVMFSFNSILRSIFHLFKDQNYSN